MRSARLGCSVLLLVALVAGCSRSRADYLKSGDGFYKQGKFKEAIVEYRNAVSKGPKNGEARLKLADAYAADKDVVGAYREYVRAADLLPASRDAQLKAGSVLLLAGKFDEAKARAEKILEANGKDVQGLMLRAAAAAGMKDYDGALQRVQEAISLDPKNAGSYVNLGALELSKGNQQEADAAFARAVELDPKSIQVRLAYANYQLSSGKAADAEATLKTAVALDPKNATAQTALANLYLATNRASEAEPHFRAAAADQSQVAGRLALADYLAGTNRASEAITILNELAKKPEFLRIARLRLARLEADRKDFVAAHASVDEVLKKESGRADALALNAQIYLAERRLDQAWQAATAAAAANPKLVEAHYATAQVALARNDADAARAALNEVLKLNPRAAGAQVQLARLELSRGSVKDATDYAAGAVKLAPADGAARLSLVRTLIASGNLQSAERELKPILAQHPEHPAVQAELGLLKLAAKDVVTARRAFESALQKDPGNADALAGLTSIDIAQGHPEAARERLHARLSARLGDAHALQLLARVELASHNQKGAEDLLQKSIAASPYSLSAYTTLARLYMTEGRLDEARSQFEALARRQSNPEGAATMIGMILEMEHKRDAAKKQYESVLAKHATSPVAANNLAWLYAEDGEKLDVALQLAQAAKQRLPNQAEVNDTLGFVYLKKDLPSLAIPHLEDAVNADPKNPAFLYRLASAQARTGNKREARQLLERALSSGTVFPEAADAKALLTSL